MFLFVVIVAFNVSLNIILTEWQPSLVSLRVRSDRKQGDRRRQTRCWHATNIWIWITSDFYSCKHISKYGCPHLHIHNSPDTFVVVSIGSIFAYNTTKGVLFLSMWSPSLPFLQSLRVRCVWVLAPFQFECSQSMVLISSDHISGLILISISPLDLCISIQLA